MKLLIATHNKGKVAELSEMLAQAGIECVSLDQAGVTFDVEETGTTFLENATLKATQYAALTGLPTLADDSGLEIDALGGEPGVYTSRYGGGHLSQPERMRFVLDKLAGVAGAARSARFRCTMVLTDAAGSVIQGIEGRCEGQIALQVIGDGGFGYDPIFWRVLEGKTLAEMNSAEKHTISHRGNALRAILPHITQLISE